MDVLALICAVVRSHGKSPWQALCGVVAALTERYCVAVAVVGSASAEA